MSEDAMAAKQVLKLVTDMQGRAMDKHCTACVGGWWFDSADPLAAVHESDCPRRDEEPKR